MNDFFTMLQNSLVKIAEDKTVIEEKRLQPEEDIVELAHPEPEYIADAKGDGALVENLNEQHKKDQEIINKMPTGEYTQLYASISSTLLKIANECDEAGNFEAADLISDALKDISFLA